jgi:hypothetical protein
MRQHEKFNNVGYCVMHFPVCENLMNSTNLHIQARIQFALKISREGKTQNLSREIFQKAQFVCWRAWAGEQNI